MNFLKTIFNPDSYRDKKEQAISNYADFWKWFVKNEKTLHKVLKEREVDIEEHFLDKILGKIGEFQDGIFLLAGMAEEKVAEIIFSAEGNVKNIIFAEELVAAAPSIKGWMFSALKPQFDAENAGIRMQNYEFNAKNIHFYSNDNPNYPDEIDITVIHDDYNEKDKNVIGNGTYIFLDHLLGELNFATIIDNVNIIGTENVEKELVPIIKLNDFLIWRQKEFIEKYEGTWGSTDEDGHSIFQAELENGHNLLMTINTEILEWDAKASHPWMLDLIIPYDGSEGNGMPHQTIYDLMNELEDELQVTLKPTEGYLNLGRQTGNNKRLVFWACKEFRKVSKVVKGIQERYADKLEIEYDIYKDKSWRYFDRFRKSVIPE